MCRHPKVLLCPVFSIGLMLILQFHAELRIPDFSPVFDDPSYGFYGRREWYQTLFFRAQNDSKPMSYQSKSNTIFSTLTLHADLYNTNKMFSSLVAHYDCIKKAHDHCGISLSKITHADRHSAGTDMGLANVEEGEAKSQGLWSRDSFSACYNTGIPTQGVLALAGADPFAARQTYHANRFNLSMNISYLQCYQC